MNWPALVLTTGGIIFNAGVAWGVVRALQRSSDAQQKDINGLGRLVRGNAELARRDHRRALIAAYRAAGDQAAKDRIVEMFLLD